MPQVGVRGTYGGTGFTVRPNGLVRRVRMFINGRHQTDRSGGLVEADLSPGLVMDMTLNGLVQLRLMNNRARAGETLLTRRQFSYGVQFSPSRRIAQIKVSYAFQR